MKRLYLQRAILGFGASAVLWLCSPAMADWPGEQVPQFDQEFWDHWADGHAELNGYALTIPRYGTLRRGTAVSIFVTETFSNDERAKAEGSSFDESSKYFPVMKLNLIKDFPTGIYDYNMMTSSFVALTKVNDRPAGSPTKVSFSAQEWCGHVYQQLLFDSSSIRQMLHSYFAGEADKSNTLDFPKDGLPEDLLLLWARGFAAPVLENGQKAKGALLSSLQRARLRHQELRWQGATLSRSASETPLEVPAGSFDVDVLEVLVDDQPLWTFHVERNAPRRIIRWESSDGEVGELKGSARLQYWKMNAQGQEAALEKLGL